MNCWKSIKLKKEFGHNRTLLISTLLGLLIFIVLYVPFSIYHGTNRSHDSGMIVFIIAMSFLPTLHSFVHILPLIMMKKRVKIAYKLKMKIFPIFTYYTKTHVTKKVSLIVLIAPTVMITLPGIISTYLFGEWYLYLLLFTCTHIGVTFIDFWYMSQIIKAPKKAFIQNDNDGYDILVKAH
ncbi:DUF3267 domain-containing protein [Oceanobacillus halophilus]|uniref:DUF3267 domain-containing protein n=1 Tax=Oceanobacillus halophilus TaxID=930130 RepID=A0A494ZXB3_9BACI|nr:DUF3267 domain-containing protein [Oceanobacillus halophilus]RKQ31274.1 DUF3267 domain-containing protein [Oceanobacillus halophilus]